MHIYSISYSASQLTSSNSFSKNSFLLFSWTSIFYLNKKKYNILKNCLDPNQNQVRDILSSPQSLLACVLKIHLNKKKKNNWNNSIFIHSIRHIVMLENVYQIDFHNIYTSIKFSDKIIIRFQPKMILFYRISSIKRKKNV